MTSPQFAQGDSDLLAENKRLFIELASRYASYAKEAGIGMIPYHDENLPSFSSLDVDEQSKILQALSQRVSICKSAASQGGSMSDAPTLTWAALKSFGLRPPSDLFNRIQSDSIIEIHSPDGKPIFQSFNYYEFCSYSLEEMYCGHWSTLYTRPDSISSQLIDFATRVYSGALVGIVPLDVPVHVVHETHSIHKFAIELTLQWGAALYPIGSSSAGASIVIDRARLAPVRSPSPSDSSQIELTQPLAVLR